MDRTENFVNITILLCFRLKDFYDLIVVSNPIHRTSSRPDSVKVIPIIENDCSTKAVVTSAGSFSHKTTGIVLAQDQSTAHFIAS